jgi:hypothetical protein
MSDFEIGKYIGEGKFGKVYLPQFFCSLTFGEANLRAAIDPERARGGAQGNVQGEAGEVPVPRAPAAGDRDPARPRPPQRAPPLRLVPRRRAHRPRPRVCGPWRVVQGPSRRWPLQRAHGRHCKLPLFLISFDLMYKLLIADRFILVSCASLIGYNLNH